MNIDLPEMTYCSHWEGCQILFLEGQCPADFSSNLPQRTCFEISTDPEDLISRFKCV